MRSKFSELATRYGIETTLPRVIPGRDFMRDFQRVLRGPIENIVKDANQQIRGTKEFLSLPDTHGIMLIFNAGNPLHALAPQHYAELVGEVIQKSNDQVRRFPHIDGLIYFSFDVTTFDEQTQKHMPFWHPAQVRGDSVDGVKRFQQDLKVAWCSYVEQMTGAKVVSHHRETGWPK